jgi:hypothetical protein
MTQRQRLEAGFIRLATEAKVLKNLIGNLTSLATINKDSIVSAINEVITGRVTLAEVDQRIQAVVGAAPDALNTLHEIATELQAQGSASAALTTSIARKVSLDATTYTVAEQTQARTNIAAYGAAEIGDPDTNYVQIIEAALL